MNKNSLLRARNRNAVEVKLLAYSRNIMNTIKKMTQSVCVFVGGKRCATEACRVRGRWWDWSDLMISFLFLSRLFSLKLSSFPQLRL